MFTSPRPTAPASASANSLARKLTLPECSLPDWEDDFNTPYECTNTNVSFPKVNQKGEKKNTNIQGCARKNDEADDTQESKNPNPESSTSTSHTLYEYHDTQSHFENLPPDVSAHILSYVSIYDIITYATVSKACFNNGYCNETTWKLKFVQRYNAAHMVDPIHEVYPDACPSMDIDMDTRSNNDHGDCINKNGDNVFWKRVYKAAYTNPHDLWLTHWNCTLPIDGIAQGRCSIPDIAFKPRPRSRSNQEKESNGIVDIDDYNDCGTNTKKNKGTTATTSCASAGIGAGIDVRFDRILRDSHGDKCPTCRFHPLMDGGALFREAMNDEVDFERREKDKARMKDKGNEELEQQIDSDSDVDVGDDDRGGSNDVNGNENSIINDEIVSDPTIVHEIMTTILSKSIEEVDTLGHCIGYGGHCATPSEVIRRSTKHSLSKWCRRMRAVHNLDLKNEQSWDFRVSHDTSASSAGNVSHDPNNEDHNQMEMEDKDRQNHDQKPLSLPNHVNANAPVQPQPSHKYRYSPFMERRRQESKRAFEQAATFHRHIHAEQYRSSGLNFMSDALFFPIEPCHEKLETLNHLGREGIYTNNSHNTSASTGLNGKVKEVKAWKMSELEHSILDMYEVDRTEEVDSDIDASPSPPDPLNDARRTRVFDDGTLGGVGPKFETAQHSWHVVRLTNPDYERHISFRIYVQRPECYCAYPSEGFLKPGETAYITLGVRTLGSLMAKAYDCTDVLRDENPLFLSDLLEEESFLPLNGFAIRYITAPAVPCVPIPFYRSSDANWSSSNVDPSHQRDGDFAESRDDGLVNRMWCNLQTEAEIRTIHVSTHVHGMYSFDQFQHQTMVPFDIRQKRFNLTWLRNRAAVMYYPLTLMCPLLHRKDPRVFSDIHDMDLEMDPCSEGFRYRTEKKCSSCGRDWGARSEYLGRMFALRKAVCNENLRMRSRQIHRSVECLKAIPELYETFMDKIKDDGNSIETETALNKLQQLLYCVHTVLVSARGDNLMTSRQMEMLTIYEFYENMLSEQVASCMDLVKGTASKRKTDPDSFWRSSGIYGTSRVCEDGNSGSFENIEELRPYLKDEPQCLKTFKTMNHHKGYYDIGKMEDPNHPQKDDYCDIDMVENSLKLGAKSAISMINSPKSIQGRGTYELSIYPGILLKSCLPQADSFLRVHKNNDSKLKGFASRVIEKMKMKDTTDVCIRHRLSGLTRDKSWAPLHINDLDPGGYHLMMFQRSREMKEKYNVSSLTNMTKNVPDPGCGRFALSIASGKDENAKVIPMFPFLTVPSASNTGRTNRLASNQQNDQPPPPVGGLRILGSVWYVCDIFGLKVVDESTPGIVMLDRRMMIAVQWFSFTLMVFPLLWSLIARWAGWIPTHPPDYILKGLSSSTRKEMRYVSSFECGVLAVIFSILYIFLGRCAERYTLRTFERAMVDDFSKSSMFMPHVANASLKKIMVVYRNLVDHCIPIYVQRLFWRSPGWHSRSRQDIQRHILKKRSVDGREHRSVLHAKSGQQRGDRILKQRPIMRSLTKGGICVLVGLSSFSSCSPNYSLNLCTVFFCSIATGLSISINHMETTRTPRGKSVISSFDNMNFHTAVVVFFLIGQVVGSSGGIQFLAEFVVTAVGLLLGGAATVSTAGIESWLSFFGLSSTAFWGYFLSRVGLASSVRYKKCGLASILLICSLIFMTILWVGTIKAAEDELPTKLMILRYDSLMAGGSAIAVLAGRHLLT